MTKNLIIFLLLTGLACSKKGAAEKDYDAPVIVISTPTDNQVFTAGQQMQISGSVTDNKYISQIHIEISNHQTGEEYLHVHIHPASSAFNFNQSFTVNGGIQYRVRVIADDPSSNSSVSSVTVSGN